MRKALIIAAAATLLAVWFAPDQDGGVVGPAAATTTDTQSPAMQAPQEIAPPPSTPGADLHIQPRIADDDIGNVFAKQSWAAAAASPIKVMAEATPQQQQGQPAGAPPLPFQFMGRFADDGRTAYFLQADGQNVVARPGEKINDNYLLDSVSGDTMTFIYLPLNQKQTLVVGDTN